MPEVILRGYECARCGHKWVPRDDDKPKVCPKCKSPYWDKPRSHPRKNAIDNTKLSDALKKMIKQEKLQDKNR